MAIDDGIAVHYTALEKGTSVYGSDEVEIGKVCEVLDNYQEHIFDGLVVDMGAGDLRFVDAPEVARTAERGVTLNITSAQAAELSPPEKPSPALKPTGGGGGMLSRFFGGGRKKD